MVTIRSRLPGVARSRSHPHGNLSSSTAVPAYTWSPPPSRRALDSPSWKPGSPWRPRATHSVQRNHISHMDRYQVSLPDFWRQGPGPLSPSTFCHTPQCLGHAPGKVAPTDFLRVHSSRSSPIPRRNITEPAVSKSRLRTDLRHRLRHPKPPPPACPLGRHGTPL